MPLTINRPDYTASVLNGVWSQLISVLAPRLPYSVRVNQTTGVAVDNLDINETDIEAQSIVTPFDVMNALARIGQANGQGTWNAVYDQEVDKYRLDVLETVTVNPIEFGIIYYPPLEEAERIAYVYMKEVGASSFEYSSTKFETDTVNGWNRHNLNMQEDFEGLGFLKWGAGGSGINGIVEEFNDFNSEGYDYFNVGDSFQVTQVEKFDVGAWPEGISPSDGSILYLTTDISSQVTGSATNFVIPAYDTSRSINLRVYYNGQRLTTGVDVTMLTATTFSVTFAPVYGSELVVDYKPQ